MYLDYCASQSWCCCLVATGELSGLKLRDSLMVEIHNRWTREEALEAAGLSE